MEFKLPTVERDIAMANLLYAWSVGWDSDPRWQEAAQRLWSELLMRADGEGGREVRRGGGCEVNEKGMLPNSSSKWKRLSSRS